MTVCLFLSVLMMMVMAQDAIPDVMATPEPEPTVHQHLGVNHTENVQYGKVTQLGRKGAYETMYQNVLINENLECSRCRLTRLIGCLRGVCHYRCYRRCFDGNGTNWDEAIRFTMRGSR